MIDTKTIYYNREFHNSVSTLEYQIGAWVGDTRDKAILEAINKFGKENGIDELIVIDRTSLMIMVEKARKYDAFKYTINKIEKDDEEEEIENE